MFAEKMNMHSTGAFLFMSQSIGWMDNVMGAAIEECHMRAYYAHLITKYVIENNLF